VLDENVTGMDGRFLAHGRFTRVQPFWGSGAPDSPGRRKLTVPTAQRAAGMARPREAENARPMGAGKIRGNSLAHLASRKYIRLGFFFRMPI
jgi:hypothetical protein